MPAKPITPETLQLIDATRLALAERASGVGIEEKTMFGCHVFMVDGKMCLGVENDELLVRLPPANHSKVAEMPGLRPLSSRGLMDGYFLIGPTAYASREQWYFWIDAALAFNPQAKATRKSKSKAPTPSKTKDIDETDRLSSSSTKAQTPRKHPIFDSE